MPPSSSTSEATTPPSSLWTSKRTARPSACRFSARRAAASTWSQTSDGIGGVSVEPMALANDACELSLERCVRSTDAAVYGEPASGDTSKLMGSSVPPGNRPGRPWPGWSSEDSAGATRT